MSVFPRLFKHIFILETISLIIFLMFYLFSLPIQLSEHLTYECKMMSETTTLHQLWIEGTKEREIRKGTDIRYFTKPATFDVIMFLHLSQWRGYNYVNRYFKLLSYRFHWWNVQNGLLLCGYFELLLFKSTCLCGSVLYLACLGSVLIVTAVCKTNYTCNFIYIGGTKSAWLLCCVNC